MSIRQAVGENTAGFGVLQSAHTHRKPRSNNQRLISPYVEAARRSHFRDVRLLQRSIKFRLERLGGQAPAYHNDRGCKPVVCIARGSL